MPQIEIEKKFSPTEEQLVRLVNGAKMLGRKDLEDTYFDTDDFSLTTHDYWFRFRNDTYELKAPLDSKTELEYQTTTRYRELTTVAEIRDELGLPTDVDFETALAAAGIKKFVTAYSKRNRYEKEGFEIDVDTVTYADSDFTYSLVEIELLIADESKADEAEAKIIAFALAHGLAIDQKVYGKIRAFLQSQRPNHFKVLVEAGVL